MRRVPLSFLLVASALAVGIAATAAAAGLTVQAARMPLPPSGSDVGAVYLTLHNDGERAQVVVGVESSQARSAMLHESGLVHGTARMRPVEQLTIPPGRTLALAPGALHIMLVGLKGSLHVGQDVPLVLRLADGERLDVSVRVQPTGSQ